jgi:hypothetical protein
MSMTKIVAEMSDAELRELVDDVFYHHAMAELEAEEQAVMSFLTEIENRNQQPPPK